VFYEDKLQAKENPIEKKISCFIYKSKQPYYPNHCHTHLEIIYIIDGSIKISLNGKPRVCNKGDLVFVPILTPHSIMNIKNKSCEHIVLQLSLNFLDDSHGDFHDRTMLYPGEKLQDSIAYHIDKQDSIGHVMVELQHLCGKNLYNESLMTQEYSNENGNIIDEWQLKGIIFQLFSLLLDNELIMFSNDIDDFQDIHELSRIQPVLSMMINHPEENLSMEDAAKTASMSYYNFSRTFKRLLGHSFVDYKNILRIRQAEELLYETDKSITEVAELVSFGSLSYFNRTFKKYSKITPSDYRNKISEQNKTKI